LTDSEIVVFAGITPKKSGHVSFAHMQLHAVVIILVISAIYSSHCQSELSPIQCSSAPIGLFPFMITLNDFVCHASDLTV
jgi:hypothetical protein